MTIREKLQNTNQFILEIDGDFTYHYYVKYQKPSYYATIETEDNDKVCIIIEVNLDTTIETLKEKALQEIKTIEKDETEIIEKYLSVLGWGYESETPLKNYNELRDHLDRLEEEMMDCYWDYPIEEVLDRIQNNEIFFCIGGRMFETHQFLIDKEV
jgi:hypothetical protein